MAETREVGSRTLLRVVLKRIEKLEERVRVLEEKAPYETPPLEEIETWPPID